MRRRTRNIIFIGHDASLSGAPILLFNLLLLLKKDNAVKIFVVIRREGPFIEEYRKHFPVLLIKSLNYGHESNFISKAGSLIASKIKILKLFFKAAAADLIFSNTIVNGRLLKVFSPFKKKVITYVHELENVIEAYMASGDSALALKLSSGFAYPSLKVKDTLENKYAVSEQKLKYLAYYFPVDLGIINNNDEKLKFREAFRIRFNITADFVVGNIGVLCKRKGTDLFIEVCERVVKQSPSIQFCWIGAFENKEVEIEFKNMIEARKLSDNIVLTGPLPHHYYNCCNFDLFLLSSREDPYPLVVLESAFMKVPTICFRESGGITQFVEDDAGWIIPGFSLDEAAKVILQLYDNRQQIYQKGEVAYNKALDRHANGEYITNQFYDLINHVNV